MSNPSQKLIVVKDYLNRFPQLPSLTISKKIYNENKLLYKDVEEVRSRVRYARGSYGNKHRKQLKDKTHLGKTPVPVLPESHQEKRTPLQLPLANNNILLLSDFHVPYHDNDAINCALEYGKKEKINTILLNGDVMDFYMLSRFMKDPRQRSVKQEFDAARALLVYIRHVFPKADIYWLMGNHDMRYEHWLMTKAPEIFDDSYYKLEERLRLNELKIKVVDELTMVKAGKLFIAHGHKWSNGQFSPVNAARGLWTRLKRSAIMGHTHSVSQHTEKDVAQELTSCWSTGCLCELQPAYNPWTNKFVHGFAHIQVHKDKNYTVKNYTIIDGQIL